MSVCTFFGHRDCSGLDEDVLAGSIEALIQQGVDEFLVGHQGLFDGMVLSCLKKRKEVYRHISFSVVLAYLPTQKPAEDLYQGCSIYPEGVEIGPPKFAIERRNKWMIDQAAFCLCYIDHTWGGAYKFAKQAKRKGLTVINLGRAEL